MAGISWIAGGLFALVLVMTTVEALAQPAGDPVGGIVESVIDNRVTLADGTSFTLGDQARITLVTTASPADLVPGQYIAITAQLGSDGVLQASIVSAFPEEQRGTGEGQRPMDGSNLMTNANIDDAVLDAVDGVKLSVSFLGQTAPVRISSATLIEIRSLGARDDLVAGTNITTVVNNGVSGNVSIR